MADYFRKFFARLSLQRLEGSLDKSLQISDEEIDVATNNRSEANFLGKGSYGTVYRGKLKETTVAIKFLKPTFSAVIRKELSTLVRFQHDNLIRLYGYNGKHVCLVLEYAALGPLRDSLEATDTKDILTVKQRMAIILGTAKGLQYLHTAFSKALVHRDISSGNVLLDKDRKAKISDFGLARSIQVIDRESVSANALNAYGTHGYMPPEAKYGVISRKYDVYGFGVLILEIISVLLPYSTKRSPHMLSDIYFQKKERKLPFPKDKNVLWPFHYVDDLLEIVEKCLHIKSKRPYIDEIIEDLEMFIKKRDSKDGNLSRDSSSNSVSQQVNEKRKTATGIRDDGVYIRPSKSSNTSKQRRPVSAPVTVKNIDNDSDSKIRNKPNSIAIESKTSSKVTNKTPTDEVKQQSSKAVENKTPTDGVNQQSSKAVENKTPTTTTPTEPPNLAMYTTDV